MEDVHPGFGSIVQQGPQRRWLRSLDDQRPDPQRDQGEIIGRNHFIRRGFTFLAGVILFLGKGHCFTPDLLVPVLTGALLSVPFSTEFVTHINETTLKKITAGLTVAFGIFTLLKVLL